MNIETTININKDLLDNLTTVALRLNVTKRHLISSIAHYLILKTDRSPRAWRRVRYQERREKMEWRTLHIVLRGDEYEFFIDLRKVFKLSVSFIVSEAIELYLSEIESLLMKDVDSYRYRNYAFINSTINNVRCWILCWGIPNEIPIPLLP